MCTQGHILNNWNVVFYTDFLRCTACKTEAPDPSTVPGPVACSVRNLSEGLSVASMFWPVNWESAPRGTPLHWLYTGTVQQTGHSCWAALHVCVCAAGMALHPEDNHGSRALRSPLLSPGVTFQKAVPLHHSLTSGEPVCGHPSDCLMHPHQRSDTLGSRWAAKSILLWRWGNVLWVTWAPLRDVCASCPARPGLDGLWDPLPWEALSWASAAPHHHLGTRCPGNAA